MRVSDIAKEFNTTEEFILGKLKALKLKAKGANQELNAAVAIVLKSEIAKTSNRPKPEKIKEVSKVVVEKKKTKKTDEDKPKKKKVVKKKEKEKVVKVKKVKKVEKKPSKVIKEEEKKKKAEKKTTEKKDAKEKDSKEKVLKKVKESSEKPKKEKVIKAEPKVSTPKATAKPRAKSRIGDQPVISLKPLPKRRKKGAAAKEDSSSVVKGKKDFGFTVKSFSEGADVAKESPEKTIDSGRPQKDLVDLEIKLPISAKDLAVRLKQKTNIVLKKLLQLGIFVNINQNLDEDIVRKVCYEFDFNAVEIKSQEEQLIEEHQDQAIDEGVLKSRAPVVTFMGHVDHGKTSLLDKIRKTKVVDREHGGITQHIGAYSVELEKGKITFLDTPGHAAFTSMRARGAHITDLVVVVIAAEEGIMPQTEEAIDHARAANVPIIIALNKIDKQNADVDRVKKQLMEKDLTAEDWGGSTIITPVSAMTGEGIDKLLESIILEAEMLELKANHEKKASGIVVEANLSRGKGSLATFIVQSGVLDEGDYVVVGPHYGKIKAMFDDHKRIVKEAGPSMPVEVLGLLGVPEPGERFYVVSDEKTARDISTKREEKLKDEKFSSMQKITLEDLYAQIQEGNIKELSIIVKADVRGSLEALKDSLSKISSKEVKLKFIHAGVGDINASDIILATASNAIIIGFHVDVAARAKIELESNLVDVRLYRVIYDAVNDITNAIEGLLEPTIHRKFLARVEVRQVFKLSKAGIISGCFVQKGTVPRKANVEVVREGEVVYSGTISSLKRFKDDVKEVKEGFECGVSLANFTATREGDILEVFEEEKIARKL